MPGGYSGPDRRSHKRIRVNFMVLYNSQDSLEKIKISRGKEIYALMLDLSQTGMAVLTEYDIPASSLLEVKFTLPALHKITHQNLPIPISIKGQVKYSRAMGRDGFRIGILFTEIGAGDRNLIADFISNC
ncbi:MAG: PilZ domain-containing protein [Candidatus Omnitrophica bacterium]|nr:PilZ domain-containing protein [Candidatus Omnitrophota bacterium]MBU1929005.1 PilZ domain-containing protein [Candidatus Omnitrophota bacterium]MBU2035679.1 PilZ domain-containing protein [Candidatus Omnitrophota bacterium]MBU2258843.1 PilZ domain-containing protein [Candidatus Omnitrophota bacterium]